MKRLSDYLGLNVMLKDENNKLWKGKIIAYSSDDYGEGEGEAVVLQKPDEPRNGIEFGINEIKSIQILQ